MPTLLLACMLVVLLPTWAPADDLAPVNAPENDLVARLHGGSVKLAPFTQRVWSEEELLRLSEGKTTSDAEGLRRLLRGPKEPEASVFAAFAFLTAENDPRLAWRLLGIHSLQHSIDFVYALDTTRSLLEQRPSMPWAYVAQLRIYTAFGEWRVGQAPVRWGGGYSGAMLLSDHPPPLIHADYRATWYLGRRLQTWQFEQLSAMFSENGERRYLMARRLRRELSPRWEISLAEAFKASKLPYAVTAYVMPFYLYQHVYTWTLYGRNDDWFNYMAEVQVKYQFAGQKAYLALLLDDVQAPHWLTRFRYRTPRKTGFLLGYCRPFPEGGQLAVEVIHTDGEPGGGVYEFKSPANRWVYRGAVMGHPAGTNRDMLWLRLDLPLSQRSYLVLEHTNSRRANATPEVPAKKAWQLQLYFLLPDEYMLGVRWQQDTIRADTRTRWLLQLGRLF